MNENTLSRVVQDLLIINPTEEEFEYVHTNKFSFSITYDSLNHLSAALINIYDAPQSRGISQTHTEAEHSWH